MPKGDGSRSRRLVRLEAALQERLGPREYRLLWLRLSAAKRAFDTLLSVAPDVARQLLSDRKTRKSGVPSDIEELFAQLLTRLPNKKPPAKVSVERDIHHAMRLIKR
jgi:hypothetical protein